MRWGISPGRAFFFLISQATLSEKYFYKIRQSKKLPQKGQLFCCQNIFRSNYECQYTPS